MTASNIYGRQVVEVLTNKSGGGVVAGDVVVIDTANNDAFTTDTAGAFTGMVGIAQDTIASNAAGRVLTAGYAALVNVNASVTRGHFGKTYTVAKQATDAGASRIVGVFCQFLTGGTTPDAHLFGITDGSTGGAGTPSTPALTLSTTNSTGSASTLIATDATIALFDSTVASPLGTAATGSAGKAARRDHVHLFLVTENFLTSPVTMTNANQFYDGPSQTLGAGTYILDGVVTINNDAAGHCIAKVWNGTTVYGAAPSIFQATAGGQVCIPIFGYVVLGGSTTVKISVASTGAGCHILETGAANGVTNKASYLRAIQIA